MSLADAARSDENDVASFANEVECCRSFDNISVDRLWAGEVIHVQASYWKDAGAFDGGSRPLLQVHPELVTHQVVNDAGW
jgi:hypothetical protein